MDGSQFDNATRFFAHSRRSLFAAVLVMTAGRLGISDAEARKKRKHKKRKQRAAAPNEFGCIGVGDLCQNADQCCSGICDGSKGKKTCRAHHTGGCPQGGAGQCTDPERSQGSCNGDCFCARTTAGSDVCAADATRGINYCSDCATDADCQDIGFPAGSVCLPLHEGTCAGVCGSNRACFPPCGTAWPFL
jgi:hypothetical protein